MKKVLLVAYYFPPIAAVASLRPMGFSRYLHEHGWTPTILTAETKSVDARHRRDEGLCRLLPSQLSIERVAHKDPQHALISFRNFMRGWISRRHSLHFEQSGFNGHVNRGTVINGSSSWKETILDWAFSFPDPECSWFRPAVRSLWRLPSSQCPDVVFATGGPWTSLLVGKRLAERFGVPFIADFRDPWTRNPYYRLPSEFLTEKAKKLECSIVSAAARVVANTEELRELFIAQYPNCRDKIVTITNGFNTNLNANLGIESSPDSEAIELSYFGTLYGNGNPLPLLEAVTELVEEDSLTSNRFRLRFVGTWEIRDDRCDVLAQALEKQGLLLREPPVPHHLCLQQMSQADVLLIMQPHSPLQTPAKTYEYISTGRPILVLGGEGATANLIKKYGLGRCCPNNAREIKQVLRRLISKEVQIRPPSIEDTIRFHYSRLTGQLAGVLDAVYSERNMRISASRTAGARS
jgi:glycosyltransferase involved in cell wall biosynthesis